MSSDHQAIDTILEFWFGAPDGDGRLAPREEWFRKDDAFDRRVGDVLGPWQPRAAAGELASWADTATGAVAFILLLDQAPRNLYRDDRRAFASDAQARDIAVRAIDNGFDRDLQPVQRMFLYIPFEHSEDLADQERSLELFTALGDETYLDYARRHHEIIARFGRFPHRNAILGRASTAEEVAFFCANPGRLFDRTLIRADSTR